MDKKQTAVEWLAGQLPFGIKNHLLESGKLEQAKAMEKQQIINAWSNGGSTLSAKSAEQYYNETYATDNG